MLQTRDVIKAFSDNAHDSTCFLQPSVCLKVVSESKEVIRVGLKVQGKVYKTKKRLREK